MLFKSFFPIAIISIIVFGCNNSKNEELQLTAEVKELIKYDSINIKDIDSSGKIIKEMQFTGGVNLNNSNVAIDDLGSIAAILYFQKNETTLKKKFDYLKIKFVRDTGIGKYLESIKFSSKNIELASKHLSEVTTFNDSYAASNYEKMYASLHNDLKSEFISVDNFKNQFVKLDSVIGIPQNIIVFGFSVVKVKTKIGQSKDEKLIVYKSEVNRGTSKTVFLTYIKPDELSKNNIIGIKL